MYERYVTVSKKANAMFQPEAFFIQKANEYRCEIWVEKRELGGIKRANAKSLMGVLSLGLTSGCDIKIYAEGEDETDAVEDLSQLLVS